MKQKNNSTGNGPDIAGVHTHTITEKWLAGTTFLEPRGQQYHAVPGFRCNCGNIYRVGQKVAVTHGKMSDKPHFWSTCDNCGNCMF